MDLFKLKLSKTTRQILIAAMSLVAASVTLYIVYALTTRGNISLTSPEGRPGATNPQCLLTLTLNRPSPSPSPTPGICANCQYQADVFWGPVIQSFAGGLRYSTTNRLITSRANYTNYPGCTLVATTPQPAPVLPTLPSNCQNPIGRRYLTATMNTTNVNIPNGYIAATITNNSTTCTYPVGLAAYKASGSNINTQNLFDHEVTDLGPKLSVTLYVKSPMNNDAPTCHNIPNPPTCGTVTPYDPPRGICAPNGITGSAFWEWRHVTATEYEVDIYRSNGTLFIDNDWQPISAFNNCEIGKCNFITTNMPLGSYYSRIRARNTTLCTASNWHQSITITVAACTSTPLTISATPRATPRIIRR